MTQIKGIVMEKQNKQAIVLTDDGQFLEIIVNNEFEIGDEVIGKEVHAEPSKGQVKKKTFRIWIAGIAAAAVVILALSIPSILNNSGQSLADNEENPDAVLAENEDSIELAYLTVDINPSIELGYDEQLLVKEARALNEDGEKVLAKGDIKGQEITEAIEKITDWSYELKYLAKDKENVVTITYKSSKENSKEKDNEVEFQKELNNRVNQALAKNELVGEVKNVMAKDNREKEAPGLEKKEDSVDSKGKNGPPGLNKKAKEQDKSFGSKDKATPPGLGNKSEQNNQGNSQGKGNKPDKNDNGNKSNRSNNGNSNNSNNDNKGNNSNNSNNGNKDNFTGNINRLFNNGIKSW